MTTFKEPEHYTSDYFLTESEVYEYLYSLKNDRFKQTQEIGRFASIASNCKVTNFKMLYKAYEKDKNQANNMVIGSRVTEFEGYDIKLNTGEWTADDYGITKYSFKEDREILACSHPILPVECLKNVDESKEKVKLAFKRRGRWETIIVDMRVISDRSRILELADYGVTVNSENSKALVSYLHDVMTLNESTIGLRNSITRLGWVSDHGFSPYIDDLVFDGDSMFKNYYSYVKPSGSRLKWIEEAKAARKAHLYNKIVIAASLASALVEPSGALPFFVHLWGVTSGSGKTVAMMMGASVWAKSPVGDYCISFKSTTVGHEVYAGFLNSLPLCMDELQVIKDKRDYDEIIYALAEGSGKLRGSRDGGLRNNKKWRNCMITTGEKPITSTSSGAGAVNRVLDLDCSDSVLFEDGNSTVALISNNYGFAGKEFIEWLSDDENLKSILETQKKYEKEFLSNDKTSKQALSASLIMAADEVASRLFFEDEPITIDEMMPALLTNAEVSINNRAYEWLIDWITENSAKFNGHSAESFGTISEAKASVGRTVNIIGSVFNRSCNDAGYDPRGFWNWLKGNKKVLTSDDGQKVMKKINGFATRCVCVIMEDNGNDEPPY